MEKIKVIYNGNPKIFDHWTPELIERTIRKGKGNGWSIAVEEIKLPEVEEIKSKKAVIGLEVKVEGVAEVIEEIKAISEDVKNGIVSEAEAKVKATEATKKLKPTVTSKKK
jgi:hypothetical protein